MVEHPLGVGVERAVLCVEQLARALGEGRAGRDAVDQDSVGPKLKGHGAGEVHDARLGGHERTLEPQGDKAGDRRDVDDPPRSLRDRISRAAALADLEKTGQVDRQDAVPFVARELVDSHAVGHAY